MTEYHIGRWDLSELTKNPKGPAFQKQIMKVEKQARKFEKNKIKIRSQNVLQEIHEYSTTS